MSLTLVLSIIILLVVFLNYNIIKLLSTMKITGRSSANKQKKTVWNIPGPYSLPFFGTKWIFLKGYKISKLHEVYADLNRKYGPIVLEVTPSGIPIVHLFDRQDIEKVLRYPSKFPFRPPTEIVSLYRKSRPDRYASIGITNEQGERWLNLRTKLTPHITSPRILQGFLPTLNVICDDFIDLLKFKRNQHNNCVENFLDIANLMGLEAVCTLMLGKRLGFLSTDSEQPESIQQLADAVKQLFISQRDSYYGLGLWKYFPTKTYTNFARSEEIIYNVISDLVDKALKEEELECNDNDVRSVFINILQTEDLDIREKKSAIIDFIAAGIETLANTIVFVLYFISQHKNARDKVYSEFETCCKGSILQQDLSNAFYTKACLQESYRIHPTAFVLARILEEDTTLSGYELKAGTVILCQNMIACQKEENFKDAKEFQPERWLENGVHTKLDSGIPIMAPFGVGKRTCPGKRFVEMELILLIAKLSLAFEIEFENKLETEFEFLLVPKAPVKLFLKDRN